MSARGLFRMLVLLAALATVAFAPSASMAAAAKHHHRAACPRHHKGKGKSKRRACRVRVHGKRRPSAHAKKASVTGRIGSSTSSSPIANSFGKDMFGIATGGNLQNEDPASQSRDLDVDHNAGARWLRTDINWTQIQNGGPTSYDWGPIDNVVHGAQARGMQVLGTIVYTPSWARPPGTEPSYGPNPALYAAFAAVAVKHYAAMGVHAYEIWNEPNIQTFWTPAPNASAYAALLKAAYVAIKAADPSATVVTGGTSPAPSDGTNISPADFLSGIYAAGGKGFFDAVGHHPYCAPAVPGDAQDWSPWYQMYGTQKSLRSVMSDNGDAGKKIWATEFGAATSGPSGAVSEAKQAEMITKGYQLWAGYSWAGPMFSYQGRDLGTDPSTRENFFGLMRNDFSPKPAYSAYQQLAASL